MTREYRRTGVGPTTRRTKPVPFAWGWLAPMYLAVLINFGTAWLLDAKGYTGWAVATLVVNGALAVLIVYIHSVRAVQRTEEEP